MGIICEQKGSRGRVKKGRVRGSQMGGDVSQVVKKGLTFWIQRNHKKHDPTLPKKEGRPQMPNRIKGSRNVHLMKEEEKAPSERNSSHERRSTRDGIQSGSRRTGSVSNYELN